MSLPLSPEGSASSAQWADWVQHWKERCPVCHSLRLIGIDVSSAAVTPFALPISKRQILAALQVGNMLHIEGAAYHIWRNREHEYRQQQHKVGKPWQMSWRKQPDGSYCGSRVK